MLSKLLVASAQFAKCIVRFKSYSTGRLEECIILREDSGLGQVGALVRLNGLLLLLFLLQFQSVTNMFFERRSIFAHIDKIFWSGESLRILGYLARVTYSTCF